MPKNEFRVLLDEFRITSKEENLIYDILDEVRKAIKDNELYSFSDYENKAKQVLYNKNKKDRTELMSLRYCAESFVSYCAVYEGRYIEEYKFLYNGFANHTERINNLK